MGIGSLTRLLSLLLAAALAGAPLAASSLSAEVPAAVPQVAGQPGDVPQVAAQPGDIPHVATEPPLDDDLLLEEEWLEAEPNDPLEWGNRAVFKANDGIYRWVLDPMADAYEFVIPHPVRRSVRRFFSNLREPANLVNELLQLRACRAGTTGARFLVNSTIGIGGLFDPAGALGLEGNNTDFGQTLAFYGVGDGAYLVLPIVGPANVRDAFGQLVDATMRPDIWLLASGPQLVFVTSDGITGYESRRIYLEELRESSFDFYAALRSAYRMEREAGIRALREKRDRDRDSEDGDGDDGGADVADSEEAPVDEPSL